ncbi:MAG: TonB-dependent receptor [Bacteroidota bacterium]
MKKKLKVLLFILLPTLSFSQNAYWEIDGQVIDNNNIPMPFANVFVNNTRIGTMADKDGKFALAIPVKITHAILVASFVGYKSIKLPIAKSQNNLQHLTLKLTAGIELKEVVVTAEHDNEWRKKWRIFKDGLLGNSDFTNSCQILNMDKIRLVYDEKKRVIGTATEPIIIQNNALGLKVQFLMEKFESDGLLTYFSGDKHFENLSPIKKSDEKKWQRNRLLAYNNSFRSFLVSLTKRKVKESGFEVFKVLTPPQSFYLGKTTILNEISRKNIAECTAEEICYYDEETDQYILKSDYTLMVFTTKQYYYSGVFKDYPFPSSLIFLPNHLALFTQNGWLHRPNGILLKDYWGNEGFSNMLPDDFFPEGLPEDSTSTQSAKSDMIVSKKITVDTTTFNNNIKLQSIVYDKSTAQNTEDKSSIIGADYKLKITEKDYNTSIFDILRQIPGLSVTYLNGNYKINFLGTNSNLTNNPSGSITPVLVLDGLVFNDEESTINVLKNINVSEIQAIGVNKFGGNAILGARGGNGSIIINLKK